MPLPDLPNELVLRIAWFVLRCATCHCHHLSLHLSPLTRTNKHLHAILTPELLRAASALQILLWAITHRRPDTASLALILGANPNIPLRETHRLDRCTSWVRLGTPVEIALRVCTQSPNNANLDTLMHLLRAGGKPPIASLTTLADAGDLSLLSRCIPYITDINERSVLSDQTLLEAAGAAGHLAVLRLLLSAGATVNSSGAPGSTGYYPPLWTICDAPRAVLQVLLDAGADASWEHGGLSLVERLLRTYTTWVDVDANVDLLAWHGARVPKGEEAIALWQAPVWENWTGGDSDTVVQRATELQERAPRGNSVQVYNEYHGWHLVVFGSWDEWGPMCAKPELERGCLCPLCPASRTGGYCEVRPLSE